ncbi:MAG: hypothetical protein AAFX10_08115, partial [Pseudomonadota bacterium]
RMYGFAGRQVPDLSMLRVARVEDSIGIYCLSFSLQGSNRARERWRDVATCKIVDYDDIPVHLTLDEGRDGLPYELDGWKVDYSEILCPIVAGDLEADDRVNYSVS